MTDPKVYQCPRCATSMEVDETAKPHDAFHPANRELESVRKELELARAVVEAARQIPDKVLGDAEGELEWADFIDEAKEIDLAIEAYDNHMKEQKP